MTCILYREFPQKAQEFLKMPRTFLALLRSFAVGTSQVMRAAEFGVLWRDPILVRGQKALVLLTCDTHRSARGASTANRTRRSMPRRSAGRLPEKMPNLGRPAHCRDAGRRWITTRIVTAFRSRLRRAQTRHNNIRRDCVRPAEVHPNSSASRRPRVASYRGDDTEQLRLADRRRPVICRRGSRRGRRCRMNRDRRPQPQPAAGILRQTR